MNKSFIDDPDSPDDGSQEVLFRFLVTANTNLKLKFEYRRHGKMIGMQLIFVFEYEDGLTSPLSGIFAQLCNR